MQPQVLQLWQWLHPQLLQLLQSSQLLQLPQLLQPQLLQLLQPQDVPAMTQQQRWQPQPDAPALREPLQPQVLHTTPAVVMRMQPPGQVVVKGICVTQLQLEHAILMNLPEHVGQVGRKSFADTSYAPGAKVAIMRAKEIRRVFFTWNNSLR